MQWDMLCILQMAHEHSALGNTACLTRLHMHSYLTLAAMFEHVAQSRTQVPTCVVNKYAVCGANSIHKLVWKLQRPCLVIYSTWLPCGRERGAIGSGGLVLLRTASRAGPAPLKECGAEAHAR